MFENTDVIKILSIDGGGIRGIIPVLVLNYLEEKTGSKINELFDFIAGTSTGGLLTLLVNKVNPYSARDLMSLYEGEQARVIFPKIKHPLRKMLKGPKFEVSGIEAVLENIAGGLTMRDTIKPCVITAYRTEQGNAEFFTNYQPRYAGISLTKIARATSAAPTYFEPVYIDGFGTYIDGGIAANNPALCAYIEVLKLLRQSGINPYSKKIIVVSLGTGVAQHSHNYHEMKNWSVLKWFFKGPIIDMFYEGNSTTVEYHLRQLLPKENYFRFQLNLPQDNKSMQEIDNSDPENIENLKAIAQYYIDNDAIGSLNVGWKSQLENLCMLLTEKASV